MNAVQAFFLLWRGLSGRPAALCRLAAGGHLQDNNLRSEVREKNANLNLILVFLQRLHYNGFNKIWCLSEGTESIMNVVLFVIFSSLEYFSIFIFLFVLFRFDVKEHLFNITVCSVVMALISHMFMLQGISNLSIFAQFFLLLFFSRLMLRTSFFNTAIMLLISYIGFAMSQTAIIALYRMNQHNVEIIPYTKNAYIVQIVSAIVICIIAAYIRINKGGFSFIDRDGRRRTKIFIKDNFRILIAVVVSILIFIIANIWILLSENPPYYTISLGLLVALLFLIYLSIKKDELDD